MKVLVVGGGGREHALVWALDHSPRIRTLRCAPGNAGIARQAEIVAIGAEDVDALLEHSVQEAYDLVVVGPEVPLVLGLADRLTAAGIAVFGPSAAAAKTEGSKVFSKEFMARHRIPTAGFEVFRATGEATAWLRRPETVYPLVVKADGLAAGKGVILADTVEQAVAATENMLSGEGFGDAGRTIVVEEMLYGTEASFFVLADGESYVELATCQDYKRALDGNQGPNTGGMGTYSPSAFMDEKTRRTILDTIVEPTIDGLKAEGSPYKGVLFIGIMLTSDGPKVLEYNCRFGDPETQVLLPRLQGDWLELLLACANGTLRQVEPAWKSEAAVCVVMASGGYPGAYRKGAVISGLEQATELEDVVVFHAGTSQGQDGAIRTSGGRVLGVTALGADLPEARDRAYLATKTIDWDGEQHRTDIGADAVANVTAGAAGDHS